MGRAENFHHSSNIIYVQYIGQLAKNYNDLSAGLQYVYVPRVLYHRSDGTVKIQSHILHHVLWYAINFLKVCNEFMTPRTISLNYTVDPDSVSQSRWKYILQQYCTRHIDYLNGQITRETVEHFYTGSDLIHQPQS